MRGPGRGLIRERWRLSLGNLRKACLGACVCREQQGKARTGRETGLEGGLSGEAEVNAAGGLGTEWVQRRSGHVDRRCLSGPLISLGRRGVA